MNFLNCFQNIFIICGVEFKFLRGTIMLFEVYKDNKRVMYTEDESCIPSAEKIKDMKAAGYKVLLDGKVCKTTKEKK